MVTLFSAAMGLVTLVAAVLVARSGSRAALRVMAVARILSGLTALPAFFVVRRPGGVRRLGVGHRGADDRRGGAADEPSAHPGLGRGRGAHLES